MSAAVRHSTTTVRQAQTMAAGGWSAYKIAQVLGVSRATVRVWTDADYAAHRRRQQADSAYRRRHQSGARWGRLHFRTETTLRRIRQLHAAGLSNADVARVMALDFGGDWDRWHVQTVLDGGVPHILRRQRREREAA